MDEGKGLKYVPSTVDCIACGTPLWINLNHGYDEYKFHCLGCGRSFTGRKPGMSTRDETVEMSKYGGYHSKIPYRFDLLPPEALLRAATILKTGVAKYPVNNWRLVEPEVHMNHALAHLAQYMAGDSSEDHLGNALCRVMFLIATSENPPVTRPQVDEDSLAEEELQRRFWTKSAEYTQLKPKEYRSE